MAARLRRLRDTRDAGFSLAELLVTMVLLGVLMSFVLATTTQLFKSQTDNATRTDSLQEAQTAMDSVSKWVRTAVLLKASATGVERSRFKEATAGRLTLFAATGDTTTQVTFSVQGGQLMQETVLPDAGATDLTAASYSTNRGYARRVLARYIQNPTAMFGYVASSATPTSRPAPVPSMGTDADRASIVAVQVRLDVNTNPGRGVAGAVLDNTVYPFNAEG
jgi:prepilin-type N-terminal cleavage/methylation domain-containing protein